MGVFGKVERRLQEIISYIMEGHVGLCDISVVDVIKKVERSSGTEYFPPGGSCWKCDILGMDILRMTERRSREEYFLFYGGSCWTCDILMWGVIKKVESRSEVELF